MPRTRSYANGRIVAEGFPLAEISDQLEHPDRIVFADLTGHDTNAIMETLRDELDLHDLAVEDALGRPQRPKIDRYPRHIFLSTYETGLDDAGELTLAEIGVFVTSRALITVRKGEAFDLESVLRLWDSAPQLAPAGVTFLLQGLLDHVVESYLETLDTLDDRAEELEDDLFGGPEGESHVRRHSLTLRKNLLRLRKVALPMREVLLTLIRSNKNDTEPAVDDVMLPYYQDVYDHVLRVTEWSDTLRDVIATTLDTQASLQNNRLNVTVQRLTGWAAIIAVPTLITGFYGENVPFPGFGHRLGLVASLVLIVSATSAVYINFRRRGWV
jgi:magnesium transporter